MFDLIKLDFRGVEYESDESDESFTIVTSTTFEIATPRILFVSLRVGWHDFKCWTLPVEFLLSVKTFKQKLNCF